LAETLGHRRFGDRKNSEPPAVLSLFPAFLRDNNEAAKVMNEAAKSYAITATVSFGTTLGKIIIVATYRKTPLLSI
jgi:hypothetical protein